MTSSNRKRIPEADNACTLIKSICPQRAGALAAMKKHLLEVCGCPINSLKVSVAAVAAVACRKGPFVGGV
eukprot:1160513-Pelagomonas_calceolata.AAC.8